MWLSDSDNFVFLVAVNCISELTKFELIISIVEHNYIF